MTNKKGILIVMSGPSGVGKGTICKEIVNRSPDVFLSISATTREKREGETNGINYYFIKELEFKEKIENDGFIEWACFCGNYYGTPKDKVDEMLSLGKNVILEIEVQGAMKVRDKFPEGVFIFVIPPSMHTLRARIEGRGTESKQIIEERLKTAAWEFEHIAKYNYILLNNDLDAAVDKFFDILSAEQSRVERNFEFIKEVLVK